MTTYTNDQALRDVNVDGYRLETWDTYKCDRQGKARLGYRLTAVDGTVVFEGTDFCCSPTVAIDSDAALRAILGFLTLRPGDTDSEYFDNYSAEQMAFADGAAEELQMWADDDGPDFVSWPSAAVDERAHYLCECS